MFQKCHIFYTPLLRKWDILWHLFLLYHNLIYFEILDNLDLELDQLYFPFYKCAKTGQFTIKDNVLFTFRNVICSKKSGHLLLFGINSAQNFLTKSILQTKIQFFEVSVKTFSCPVPEVRIGRVPTICPHHSRSP